MVDDTVDRGVSGEVDCVVDDEVSNEVDADIEEVLNVTFDKEPAGEAAVEVVDGALLGHLTTSPRSLDLK